jgi:hypothetical protein
MAGLVEEDFLHEIGHGAVRRKGGAEVEGGGEFFAVGSLFLVRG